METWKCIVCRASATVDLSVSPVRYNTSYPADTGPYAERPLLHDCPVKKGLLPEQLAEHANALKVN